VGRRRKPLGLRIEEFESLWIVKMQAAAGDLDIAMWAWPAISAIP
jgi:hypothetical protein